jgi:hypothetical protein
MVILLAQCSASTWLLNISFGSCEQDVSSDSPSAIGFVSSFDYTINFRIVQGYSELTDSVTFEEEVGPYVVLCTSVHYHTFWGAEPANYLCINQVWHILRCALF